MLDIVREFCLALPFVKEKIQWEEDLLFCVGGKMFAVAALNPGHRVRLSCKATPEAFAELTEKQGIIPAPYLARAQWVALETWEALPLAELQHLLRTSYDLIFAKLPKKTRLELAAAAGGEQTVKQSEASE